MMMNRIDEYLNICVYKIDFKFVPLFFYKMTTLVQIVNQFSDGSGNIVIPDDQKDTFREALMNIRKPSEEKKKTKYKKDPNAPKRPTSAYMIWLNKNRNTIKNDYFSDYADITDWTLDSKCNYYESKGLKIPIKEGKPLVVALVTAKAGVLWKSMTVEEKAPLEPVYEFKIPEDWCGPHFNMNIDKTIKDVDGKTIKQFKSFDEALEKAISLDTQCFGITQTKRGFSVKIGVMTTCSSSISSWTKKDFVNPIKSKKGRGRPKSKVEDSDDESNTGTMNEVSDADAENENDDAEECEVDEVVIYGETYYKSEDGTLYDPETSEEVGKLVDGEIVKE